MPKILINNRIIGSFETVDVSETLELIAKITGINSKSFYLEQNGKRCTKEIDDSLDVHCVLRVLGGKGGFGSMLRAIGAQIEKTTNREACRDLSGRRLRDINEEKRLKAWLDKQEEREREAEERKKRKIEKLLAVPKHDFKDEQYEEARSKLTEKVNDAVEEGFKKALATEQATNVNKESVEEKDTKAKEEKHGLKRKNATSSSNTITAAKKKTALWIGDDISDTDSSTDSDSSIDSGSDKK